MRWQNRERSDNVEDRRGETGGAKPLGIIGVIILLIGAFYGVDLSGVVNNTAIVSPTDQSQPYQASAEEEKMLVFSKVILRETEKVWEAYFQKHGATYTSPIMVVYNGKTHTGCGTGSASVGPFYCPNDRKLYIDLAFYNLMKNELGASGEAAFAYVLAHEVGHHVQMLTGTLQKVHEAQAHSSKLEANALSVRLELQADCFAGVWAYHAEKDGLFEAGDIEDAYNAAESVGDDRLQQRAQGYVTPHNYTHGTSEQRKKWFDRGLKTGNVNQCNTFAKI